MRLWQIFGKIPNKIFTHVFKLFNSDYLTLLKIKKRNDLIEIGTSYGGWVVPTGLLSAESICYCAGCGEDISFDTGLIDKFGCEVFAFDPTPRAVEHVKKVAGKNQKYHFFEIGLWEKEEALKFYAPKNPDHVSHSLVNLQKTEDYILVNVKRLSRVMEEFGHKTIDLLKIDIEGAEYKVIDTIIEDKIDIKVICVEYDEYYNPLDCNFRKRIKKSANSLISQGYILVCAQGNGNYTFVKGSL